MSKTVEFEELGLLEIRTKEGHKGLAYGDEIILPPKYDHIGHAWPWKKGYIFIVKDLSWFYGIAFWPGNGKANVWISEYRTKIINLKNGWFASEGADFLFDYQGNPKK